MHAVQTKHIINTHHPPGPRKTMSSPAATTTTTTTTTPTTMPTDGGIVDIVGVGTIDEQVANLTTALQREKVAKRKMYGYLVKIADELKTLRAESEQLICASEYSQKAWHEGGMWRGPNVLPGASASSKPGLDASRKPSTLDGGSNNIHGNDGGGNGNGGGGRGGGAANNPCSGGPALVPRVPVSLTDLFLDIVTVTSFSRVGAAIQDRGGIDLPILAYFAVFWMIWKKEESYSTRFDTTDISSHLTTLSVCFALLGGSLSAYSTFDSGGCTRIMGVAGFSALLHVVLHVRVFFWFKDVDDATGDAVAESVNSSVKRYAVFNSVVNTIETITWGIGMLLPSGSDWRKWTFLLGVVLNMRIPGMIMPNDFHAACSKRGVLFILLLGFNLQSILITASPFFNYWEPTWDQYAFLFLACFLLFMIKLLYVDDTYTIAPHDHALLYNSAAGFFFNMGNFALLLFTTVLGSGLNLLTHSYLAAAAALPNDAKNLVCGGLSAVVFSIFFIKCMHIRRVPTDPKHHEQMFLIAYSAQVVGILIVVGITARMCFLPAGATYGLFALLMRNEIEMLFVLVIFSVLLLVLSYSDEALELRLYSDASEASENRVRPFGIWTYFSHDEPLQLEAMALERNRAARLAQRSPLLGASVVSLSGSISGFSMYNSFANFAAVSKEDV